jgi:Type IV secretion system pilin
MKRPIGKFIAILAPVLSIVAVLPMAVAAVLLIPAIDAHAAVLSAEPKDLPTVIGSITKWLVGLLVSLATLFLTIGFLRLLLAGGDPGEVAKGKEALKNAAIGFGGALLAPLLVKILQSFVGG